MHKIKKYANRKLYDTNVKKYVSMDYLSDLINSGKEIEIIDNETGDDLTASIVSRLMARKKGGDEEKGVSSGLLIQLFRKGGGALTDYTRRYVSIVQSAFTMAEDEVDKFVNMLIKDKEISKSEGSKLKKEIAGYTDSVKNWIGDNIDKRVNDALSAVSLVKSDQVDELNKRLNQLEKKMKTIEKL